MALTTAQLKALPYKKTAHSSGISTKDYKKQYAEHGTRVRWWKSYVGSANGSGLNGTTYIEQYLPDTVRVMVHTSNLEVQTPEFGKIRIGDLWHNGLPEEIELAIGDRTSYPDNARPISSIIKPSGEETDDLPHMSVESIDSVMGANGVLIDALDYELYGRAIRWRGTPPTGPITVRYYFSPQYVLRGEGDRQGPIGSNDKRLPQRVPLHLVDVGKEAGDGD